jgi:hypothetical protein
MDAGFDASEFEACYPVPFLMKEYRQDWWFRIHSLPDSKRYPTTTEDWAVLMLRHQELADAVLTAGSRCRILYSQRATAPFPQDALPAIDWKHFRSVGEDEDRLACWAASIQWRFEDFAEVVRKKVEDQIVHVAFHSLQTDSLYCPYDGGADVFSLNTEFLAAIRSRFRGWRSPHPLGL